MTSETAPGTGGEGRPDRADPARPSAVSGDPTPSAEPDPVAARADSAPVSDSPDDTPPATTDTDSVPAAPADAAMPAMTPADSDTAAGTVEDSVPHAEEPVSDDTTQVRAADGDVPAGAAGDADRTVEVDPVPPADESPTQHVDPASHGAAGPFPPPGGTTPTDSVPPGSVPPGSVPPGAGSVPPGDDGTAGGYGAPPPPPPGFGAPPNEGELPPIAAFAFRHGLVRPVQGKKIVGVCAALGRATNTDPVLWRVVLTVTAFFGGVGLLAYVLGWLLTPREDDRATPLESVLGRGRSSTSPAVAVLLGVAGIGLVFFILNDSFRFTVLAAALAATVAVVLTRRSQARSAAPASAGGAPVPPPGPPPAPTTPTATAQPTAASYTVPPTGVQQPAYRAPFAPHGPYGPGVPPPPPPPQFHGRPPRPPKAPKEKSALGRITFFALCLA
ncbi:MAG TPA: PspC domain-containing protein, partial [Actinocatenispora sp.]